MRLFTNRAPALPRNWRTLPGAEGLLLERDLGVGHGRLKAKLLVFDSPKTLANFWRKGLGKGPLGRRCLGAVNGLGCEVTGHGTKGEGMAKWLEADPRYFCAIGLVRGFLDTEIICHEATHAGFAFAKRRSRSPWDEQAVDMDEELVCYPSGRIAAALVRELRRAKLVV